MSTDASNIEYEVDDSIATVRLNRPEKLNAFTFTMIERIRDAVERASADEGVVAIIITGTGRAFSAGLDTEISRARQRVVHRRAVGRPPPMSYLHCSVICCACRSR